jgi:hypothetical protein
MISIKHIANNLSPPPQTPVLPITLLSSFCNKVVCSEIQQTNKKRGAKIHVVCYVIHLPQCPYQLIHPIP